MATTESFDEVITRCPLDDTVECLNLVKGLEIARAASGEVFVDDAVRDRDSSNRRVAMLMRTAARQLLDNPCESCPSLQTIQESD